MKTLNGLLFSATLLTVFVCGYGFAAVFETDQLRLEIGNDGRVHSLSAKHDSTEYTSPGARHPVAKVYRGGRSVPTGKGPQAAVIGRWMYQGGTSFDATGVQQRDDKLVIEFGTSKVTATFRVLQTGYYLAFELLGVEGGPVDRIEFFRLNLRRLPMLGQWVNLVSDNRFGICLCGGNIHTDIEMLPGQNHVEMTAAAEIAVSLRGPTAVLFGCPDPQTKFLDAMAIVERDFHLPPGATSRRSPIQRFSYLWAGRPDPQNISEYIRWAKLGGFRMILLSYRAFANGAGHFEWNNRYPNGMSDLKRVTDAIRTAGLKTGLHIHYSKASKKDPYVMPIPDDRLHKVRTFTLVDDVTADSAVLTIREDPVECTLDKDRRLLKIGKELVEYENFSSRTPFQFTGCRRGHLSTRACPHTNGTTCVLLDVDTWPDFVRFDQNTDIQDEVAQRLADIYRQTGPYDMVYFDGAEDVHEPFWYHVSASQYRVFKLLDPPPPVCEAAHYTHSGWHMISRANAYDNVASIDGMKDFCRLMPCPTAAARALDFSRIDFGWLGRFGRTKTGYAGPDIYEYIASRAAAWDCPLSLNATLEDFKTNPRAEDCLAAIKIWEDARLGSHLSEADRRILRNVAPEDAHYVSCFEQRTNYENSRTRQNLTASQQRILADRREHHLFINEQGRYELVQIEELDDIAQGTIKAFMFHRAGKPDDTWVLAWAVDGERRLRVPSGKMVAERPFGTRLQCISEGDSSELVIGPRTYLLFAGTDTRRVRQLFSGTRIIH